MSGWAYVNFWDRDDGWQGYYVSGDYPDVSKILFALNEYFGENIASPTVVTTANNTSMMGSVFVLGRNNSGELAVQAVLRDKNTGDECEIAKQKLSEYFHDIDTGGVLFWADPPSGEPDDFAELLGFRALTDIAEICCELSGVNSYADLEESK